MHEYKTETFSRVSLSSSRKAQRYCTSIPNRHRGRNVLSMDRNHRYHRLKYVLVFFFFKYFIKQLIFKYLLFLPGYTCLIYFIWFIHIYNIILHSSHTFVTCNEQLYCIFYNFIINTLNYCTTLIYIIVYNDKR